MSFASTVTCVCEAARNRHRDDTLELVGFPDVDDGGVREAGAFAGERRHAWILRRRGRTNPAPDPSTVMGRRDRAILAVGFQVGCRRAEIASLQVESLHTDQGYDALRFTRKGGEQHALAIHAHVARRIRDYLEVAGHGDDYEGPLFRPTRSNRRGMELRRHLDPDMIDRILRKYVAEALGTTRGYSAHSMRATFITTALKNGANLEDVQEAVGHADPTTTKLYDSSTFLVEPLSSPHDFMRPSRPPSLRVRAHPSAELAAVAGRGSHGLDEGVVRCPEAPRRTTAASGSSSSMS